MLSSSATENLELLGLNRFISPQSCLLCDRKRNFNEDPLSKCAPKQTLFVNSPCWICATCRGSNEIDALDEMDQGRFSSLLAQTAHPREVLDLSSSVQSSEHNEDLEDDDHLFNMYSAFDASVINSNNAQLNGSVPANKVSCSCESCVRLKELEQLSTQSSEDVNKLWLQLKESVIKVYKDSISSSNSNSASSLPHHFTLRDIVQTLCLNDPHHLFRRLEAQATEYMLEVKAKLLSRLTSGRGVAAKTPSFCLDFMQTLLNSFSNTTNCAQLIQEFIKPLEQQHLSLFKMTWVMHNQNLFRTVCWMDPLIKRSLRSLLAGLTQGCNGCPIYPREKYISTYKDYVEFTEEMTVLGVVWAETQHLLDLFDENQTRNDIKARNLSQELDMFERDRFLWHQQMSKFSNSKAFMSLYTLILAEEANHHEKVLNQLTSNPSEVDKESSSSNESSKERPTSSVPEFASAQSSLKSSAPTRYPKGEPNMRPPPSFDFVEDSLEPDQIVLAHQSLRPRIAAYIDAIKPPSVPSTDSECSDDDSDSPPKIFERPNISSKGYLLDFPEEFESYESSSELNQESDVTTKGSKKFKQKANEDDDSEYHHENQASSQTTPNSEVAAMCTKNKDRGASFEGTATASNGALSAGSDAPKCVDSFVNSITDCFNHDQDTEEVNDPCECPLCKSRGLSADELFCDEDDEDEDPMIANRHFLMEPDAEIDIFGAKRLVFPPFTPPPHPLLSPLRMRPAPIPPLPTCMPPIDQDDSVSPRANSPKVGNTRDANDDTESGNQTKEAINDGQLNDDDPPWRKKLDGNIEDIKNILESLGSGERFALDALTLPTPTTTATSSARECQSEVDKETGSKDEDEDVSATLFDEQEILKKSLRDYLDKMQAKKIEMENKCRRNQERLQSIKQSQAPSVSTEDSQGLKTNSSGIRSDGDSKQNSFRMPIGDVDCTSEVSESDSLNNSFTSNPTSGAVVEKNSIANDSNSAKTSRRVHNLDSQTNSKEDISSKAVISIASKLLQNSSDTVSKVQTSSKSANKCNISVKVTNHSSPAAPIDQSTSRKLSETKHVSEYNQGAVNSNVTPKTNAVPKPPQSNPTLQKGFLNKLSSKKPPTAIKQEPKAAASPIVGSPTKSAKNKDPSAFKSDKAGRPEPDGAEVKRLTPAEVIGQGQKGGNKDCVQHTETFTSGSKSISLTYIKTSSSKQGGAESESSSVTTTSTEIKVKGEGSTKTTIAHHSNSSTAQPTTAASHDHKPVLSNGCKNTDKCHCFLAGNSSCTVSVHSPGRAGAMREKLRKKISKKSQGVGSPDSNLIRDALMELDGSPFSTNKSKVASEMMKTAVESVEKLRERISDLKATSDSIVSNAPSNELGLNFAELPVDTLAAYIEGEDSSISSEKPAAAKKKKRSTKTKKKKETKVVQDGFEENSKEVKVNGTSSATAGSSKSGSAPIEGKVGNGKRNKQNSIGNSLDADEIFRPRENLDGLDEGEKELEMFKRFCMDAKPVGEKPRKKICLNLKDINMQQS